MKALRQSLKKGGSGAAFIKQVPANDAMLVRFLTEPEEWFGYNEHYDQTRRAYYPCVADDCPGCAQDERKSFRYLANAVDLDEDRVIPLKLPKTLATRLTLKYDKYDTLMDRDYELTRSGEGLDTDYDADAEAPMKRNMKKYEPLDLGEILQGAWEYVFGVEDDEEEKPKRSSAKGKKSKANAGKPKGSAARRGGLLDDDDDDEEVAPRPKKKKKSSSSTKGKTSTKSKASAARRRKK